MNGFLFGGRGGGGGGGRRCGGDDDDDVAQSLLMEGRGRYDCALVGGSEVSRAAGDSPSCNASNEQCAPLVLRVKPGRTYRLRIASVASLASLNLQIEV